MKITDKDALERVRVILQDCSPAARNAIRDLVQKTVGTKPAPPPPRNMKTAELKVIDTPAPATGQRIVPKIYDPNKEYEVTIGEEDIEGNWLDNWLK